MMAQQQQQHQSRDEQHHLYQQHQHQKKNRVVVFVAYLVLVVLSTALAMLVVLLPEETTAATPSAAEAVTKPSAGKARTSTNSDAVAALAIREGKNRKRKLREEEGSSTTASSSFVGRPCAINLYGLPRSFASLVLPSLLRNVVAPNLKYGCDYFVHYHDLREERSGRSGRGGSVRPDEILLLKRAVESLVKEQQQHDDGIRMPTVAFVNDTEEQFWERYGGLYETILPQTTRNNPADIGNKNKPPLLYHLPSNDTIANVLKMWHSQQSAWNLMERVGRSKQLTTQKRTPAATSNETTTSIKNSNHSSDRGDHNNYYQRVAMLRSDVVYVTPIDIYQTQPQQPAALAQVRKKENSRGARGPSPRVDSTAIATTVVIPSFAKYPVNDRMIFGPTAAVRIWASQKFSRLDGHLRRLGDDFYGGKTPLHSERYLQRTIFPAIRAAGYYRIVEDDSLCFMRARADESVWFSDCDDRRRRGGGAGRGLLNYKEGGESSSSSSPSPPIMATERNKRLIEQMIGRSCELSLAKAKGRRLIELNCAKR